MRVDKFLKVARILKKRTLSKELADQERVLINGKVAKPSSTLAINDEVEIFFGNKVIKIKILGIAKQASKADASNLYEILEERRLENTIIEE